ncbi:MAG: hypothetical protein U0J65_04245, partial [Christensenellales bacterium]|nr:hypothetical protein [Christensenellales bacterium]
MELNGTALNRETTKNKKLCKKVLTGSAKACIIHQVATSERRTAQASERRQRSLKTIQNQEERELRPRG